MVLSTQKALTILGIPEGSDLSIISTRYKQLAIKWHPEKHKHSDESKQKFKQVSSAFKRLTFPSTSEDLSLDDCFDLFQRVVFNRATSVNTNGARQNDSDSSDESEDEDSDDSDCNQHSDTRIHENGSTASQTNSNLTEEEKERKRAEKRRAKKKRQRERKRLEKEQKPNTTSKNKKDKRSSNNHNGHQKQNSTSEEDAAFDPTSAFFTKVVSKKKKSTIMIDVNPTTKKEKSNEDEPEEVVDPTVLRSRQLAIRGNEMAQVDQYTAAIQLFTEAINLDPSDFRFFGNRSYCFDRIEQYEKALRDAEKAIKLDKDWPKGHFRKGRALAGLKKFGESEKSFMQVLKLDRNCDDAVAELAKVRTHQLMDMGFSRSQSEAAIKKQGSVQSALDSLLAGVGGDSTLNDLYISGDEDEGFSVHRPAPIPPPISNPSDVKMDPTNPEGLTALWVGNVLPSVTEKRLNQLFSKFGQVTSVRPLPEKFCAFVNFKTKESAGRAMHQLQGTEIDGQKLLIKFPDNPLTNNTAGTITIRKNMANGANKQGRTHRKNMS